MKADGLQLQFAGQTFLEKENGNLTILEVQSGQCIYGLARGSRLPLNEDHSQVSRWCRTSMSEIDSGPGSESQKGRDRCGKWILFLRTDTWLHLLYATDGE